MSKFHDNILKDIKMSVYKYAPESLKITYKGENITCLLDDKYEVAINLINNNVKLYEDALKRAIRKRSKFSRKQKNVKLYVILDDNTCLSTNSYMFNSRFSNLDERLYEYKIIKEYFHTKTIDTATLGNNFEIETINSRLAYKNNFIKGVTYL